MTASISLTLLQGMGRWPLPFLDEEQGVSLKSAEALCLRACRARANHKSQIQPNPNPSPLGEGFMPPPYPLHGSGPLGFWSAVPKYSPFFRSKIDLIF